MRQPFGNVETVVSASDSNLFESLREIVWILKKAVGRTAKVRQFVGKRNRRRISKSPEVLFKPFYIFTVLCSLCSFHSRRRGPTMPRMSSLEYLRSIPAWQFPVILSGYLRRARRYHGDSRMLPVRGKEPLVSPAFHFWISNERFYDGSILGIDGCSK